MTDTGYVLLVLLLVAAGAAAGYGTRWALRRGDQHARALAAAQGRVEAYRAALAALAALARARGATVGDVRAAVAPHLRVVDRDPDATVQMTRIRGRATGAARVRRRPSPRPTHNGTTYQPGHAPVAEGD